jgi:hypothetical protein
MNEYQSQAAILIEVSVQSFQHFVVIFVPLKLYLKNPRPSLCPGKHICSGED